MAEGIINVLKPPGMTSHDVVSFIRRTYALKRVGHAGTLDPAAAGVLPVFLGRCTRFVEYLSDADKSYRAELTIGYETDTGDDTGRVLRSSACVMPDKEKMEEILHSFLGCSKQMPPMYSAIKIGGKKMYELAREGITVERPLRDITIHGISLVSISDTAIVFDVTCSKGTYIRTLCTDIGAKMECPVVMSFLVRTRVGHFSLDQAKTLEEISTGRDAVLLPPDAALLHMPVVNLDEHQSGWFLNGKSFPYDGPESGLLRVYAADGLLLGIGEKMLPQMPLTPVKVLSQA